ncbi:hypothetical protein TeGR_g2764 [Tetraparma gracilis]|uniref:SHOCT domain-containing protein n=1 Tax=Tetraparma gracilis TaxID=2962635 RepID=A0ABQ6MJY0_9STRA|nr:hypothetical protein TeGR_g2764 [Tetraparma gracilis]
MHSSSPQRGEKVPPPSVDTPHRHLNDEAAFFLSRDEEVIKAYELDRAAASDYHYRLARNWSYCMMVHPIVLCCAPCIITSNVCCLKENIKDKVEATHVAISRDGVRYVVDRHPSGCRMSFQDQGLVSKTIPFNKITDCDVSEPAGKSGPICCMVENVLTTVNIDTASSGGVVTADGAGGKNHELTLPGLVDPHQFKSDIWAMVRGDGVDGVGGTASTVQVTGMAMARGAAEGVEERMDALTRLREQGFVSSEEFEEKRKAILEDL